MKFYRYEISYREHSPPVELKTFVLLEETPKGYWISITKYWGRIWKKWIPKVSRKRFAYPTKEEALTNFIKRTEKRVMFTKNSLVLCEHGLKFAKEKLTTTNK